MNCCNRSILPAGPLTPEMLAAAHKASSKQLKALKEGETILPNDCISLNYLHFYRVAMDVTLGLKERVKAKYYASKLEAHTSKEPLPWSNYYITRSRCLARIGSDKEMPELTRVLRCLQDEGNKCLVN